LALLGDRLMSSDAIRSAIRADWPRLMPAVRYIDTINRSLPQNPPLPLPDVWGTLGFEVIDRRHLTMGANPWVQETGTISIIVVARSGHGDGPGVAAATAAMHAWDGWRDPTGEMEISAVLPPRETDAEADGNWKLFVVACSYRLQERVALP
jgi:hypothetical protein